MCQENHDDPEKLVGGSVWGCQVLFVFLGLIVCCEQTFRHIRQSRLDYDLGFQLEVPKPIYFVPCSLDSGEGGLSLGIGVLAAQSHHFQF